MMIMAEEASVIEVFDHGVQQMASFVCMNDGLIASTHMECLQ